MSRGGFYRFVKQASKKLATHCIKWAKDAERRAHQLEARAVTVELLGTPGAAHGYRKSARAEHVRAAYWFAQARGQQFYPYMAS